MNRSGPNPHLFRHSHEFAAARVRDILQRTRGPHMVHVSPDGWVRTTPRCKVDDTDILVLSPGYIGTFNAKAEPGVIEEALLQWQREQQEAQRHG